MDQVFQALIDRSRVLLNLKTVKTPGPVWDISPNHRRHLVRATDYRAAESGLRALDL
jgi:hypothetical protein